VLFLVVLAASEVVARVLDPRYLDRTRGLMVYSEDLGWGLRPGFQGEVHRVWTTVNDQGQRGPEHPEEPEPGRVRVVMLGDSIAFGHRVLDDQTFSFLLERRTRRFGVVNLAVEGYGTDQELIQLERTGLRYRPDVVVLNFCLHNDVINNRLLWDDQNERTPKPYFLLEDEALRLHDEHVRLSPLGRTSQWLWDESHLYGRLGELLPPREEPPVKPGIVSDKPTATRLTFHLIHRMAELTAEAGARFLVLLHPDRWAFEQKRRLPGRFEREPLMADIPIVNMGERYRERGLGRDEVLLDDQGHLTPLGHQIVAQEIEITLAAWSAGP
jgi:hypothetical protein